MKFILIGIAIIVLLIGSVSMFTPFPGGTLLIAGGCTLLICTSERAALKIKNTRRNKSWVNAPMTWVENKMGARLSGPMRRTRPDPSNDLDMP
ncbi:MAG: hypothetical protein ABJ327_23905 [Litoreibacter sp.]